MLTKTQSGRSIMEMMTILAIIGLLSVITFVGYEMAMVWYRANRVIKETNMLAFHMEQQFEAEMDDEDLDLSDYQPDGYEGLQIQIAGYDGALTLDSETTAFEVKITGVERAVCNKIISSGWRDPYAIFVNGQPVSDEAPANNLCKASPPNEVVMAFNNTIDKEIPDCSPGYVWKEDEKTCQACLPGQRPYEGECVDCPADHYQSGNDCKPCPAGSSAPQRSTVCSCDAGYIWNAKGTCDICPVDTYQKENQCIQCPPGATATPGSTECDCPTGSTWVEDVGHCNPPSCLDFNDCASMGNCTVCDRAPGSSGGICRLCERRSMLQSSGKQYIDTGFSTEDYNHVEAKFASTDVNQERGYVWGVDDTRVEATSYRSQFSYSKTAFVGYGPTSSCLRKDNMFPVDTGDHVIVMNNKKFLLDGSQIWTATKDWRRGPATTVLFANKKLGETLERYAKMKIYYLKMYEGNDLVAEFVPAMDWDNKPGMYETISHQMLYNKGAGSFLISAD